MLNHLLELLQSIVRQLGWARLLLSFSAVSTIHLWAIIRGLGKNILPIIDAQFVAHLAFDLSVSLAMAGLVFGAIYLLFDAIGDAFSKFRYGLSFNSTDPSNIFKTTDRDVIINSLAYIWWFLTFYIGSQSFRWIIPPLIGALIGLALRWTRHWLVRRRAASEPPAQADITLKKYYDDQQESFISMFPKVIVILMLFYAYSLGGAKAKYIQTRYPVQITTLNSAVDGYLLGATSQGLIVRIAEQGVVYFPYASILSMKDRM